MKAMLLDSIIDLGMNRRPLIPANLPEPVPGDHDVLIRVSVCGVCHTELDEIEGRTPPARFPVVPGHQVIGEVVETGKLVANFKTGDRAGVAWIYSACGKCEYCLNGCENLCPDFRATGRDVNGGYAEYMTAPSQFAFHLPDIFTDAQAAPLLCAGAVGYRSFRLANPINGDNIGLTGFGASGHIVLKVIRFLCPDSKVFVFARSEQERTFALELGACWSGDTTDTPPQQINCIIDTTPVWKPVVEAMKNLKPGGRLVINAIRKEETDKECLKNLDYSKHLWMEKEIKSVANVTRKDVTDFLEIAARIPLIPEIQEYPFEQANIALMELKERKIRGAKVLMI